MFGSGGTGGGRPASKMLKEIAVDRAVFPRILLVPLM